MRNVMFGMALAPFPALTQAQTVSSDRIEAFVAVMAEVRLLMEKMRRLREVRLSEDEKAVYLEKGLCDAFNELAGDMVTSAPTLKVAPRSAEQLRQDFLAFMVTEGCSMTRGEADNKLPAAGFSVKEMRPAIGKMLAGGEAVMDVEIDTLTSNKELCAQ